MCKTILLNENVSAGFKFNFESFSERIAQFLGWYSRPILSCKPLAYLLAAKMILRCTSASGNAHIGRTRKLPHFKIYISDNTK